MHAAGVPLFRAPTASLTAARSAASDLGYPVLLKAAAGEEGHAPRRGLG